MSIMFLYLISSGGGLYMNLGAGIGGLKYGALYVSINQSGEKFFVSERLIHGHDILSTSRGYFNLFYYIFCHLTQIHDTCSKVSFIESEELTELSILAGLRKRYKNLVFCFAAGPGVEIKKNNFNKKYIFFSLCSEFQLQYIFSQLLGIGVDFSLDITSREIIPFLLFGIQIGKIY